MNTLEELKLKRQALARAIKEIDDLVALQEQLERRVRLVLGQHAPDVLPKPAEIPTSTQSVDSDQRRSVRAGVRNFEQAVTDILTSVTEPMNRTALLEALTNHGVLVGGKDPKNTLGARMTRMPSVTNVKGKGYWLIKRAQNPTDLVFQNTFPTDEVVTGTT